MVWMLNSKMKNYKMHPRNLLDEMKSLVIIVIAVLISGVSITSISAQSQSEIPSWVKGVADFWVKGEISDSDFGESISFLIEEKIIQVEMSKVDDTEAVNKIMNLEIENKELKNTINSIERDVDTKQQTIWNLLDEIKILREQISDSTPDTYDTDTSQLTLDELKRQAVDWNYDDILRNEEYYKGKIINVEAKISTILEDEEYGDWVLLDVYTADGEYIEWIDDKMYIWYDGNRLLRGDMIQVYMVIDGLHSVESMLQGSYIYYPIGTARHVTCTNC